MLLIFRNKYLLKFVCSLYLNVSISNEYSRQSLNEAIVFFGYIYIIFVLAWNSLVLHTSSLIHHHSCAFMEVT